MAPALEQRAQAWGGLGHVRCPACSCPVVCLNPADRLLCTNSGRGRSALKDLIRKAEAHERELDVRQAGHCYEVQVPCSTGA